MNPIQLYRTLLSIICVTIYVGCTKEKLSPERLLIESLADTVWAGEKREAFLASGTGYYYYDDALGVPRKSQYGLNFYDYRFLAKWDIISESGELLNHQPEYAVVHPEYLLRRYDNGLTEKIEIVPDENALVVTVRFDQKREAIVRLWEDGRCIFAQTKAGQIPIGEIVVLSNPPDHEFPFANIESPYGALPSIGLSSSVESISNPATKVVEYPESELRGEVSQTTLTSAKEYPFPKSKEIRFCYAVGTVKQPAAKKAEEWAKTVDIWRQKRTAISVAALSGFEFQCEDHETAKGLAWARLNLRGMFFRDKNRAMLFCGLPNSTYMDGFYGCYSSVGLALSDSSWLKPIQLYQTFFDTSNSSPGFNEFGGLPSQICRGTPTYQKGLTAGAMSLNYSRIAAQLDSIPERIFFDLPRHLDQAVRSEVKGRRLVSGLLTSPGLFRSPGIPSQRLSGAVFETQALFEVTRRFLRERNQIAGIVIHTPDVVLKGVANWTLPAVAPIAVDEIGWEYREPLSASAVMKLFQMKRGGWSNRLLIPESNTDPAYHPKMKWPPESDSTQTPAHILALGWMDGGDKRLNARLLANADSVGLISATGFRSLAMTDPRFIGTHIYVYDGAPTYSQYNGDILVWTAGRLSDMYRLDGQQDSILSLFNNLTDLLMQEGVVGGLPEAINGIPEEEFDNTTQNALFSASLAEYIRIFYDHILGIKSDRPLLPEIHPNFPPEWGEVRFSFNCGGARITVTRRADNIWSASQTGKEDPVTLAVELYPEPGKRALGSITLQPNEVTLFQPTELRGGLWTVAQKSSDD